MANSEDFLGLADKFEALVLELRQAAATVDEPPAPEMLTVNAAGLKLIEESESCKLTAYQDPGGVWTIGWGHTLGVKPGDMITQAEADRIFVDDIAMFAAGVYMAVNMNTTENQFSAMVSLAYNIGLQAFKTSHVLLRHNQGNFISAAANFAAFNRAGGRVLPGLVTRRAKEAALYKAATT